MDTCLPPIACGESPSRLDIALLGRFTVAVDGIGIATDRWPSLRATQLVQLLSLQPRRRMSRDVAIDALWPQLDPEAGAANLRKALHHGRQALGRHDGITLHAGELALWPERVVVVDADAFEELALAALRTGDPAECAEVASRYGGDLLPGSLYEAWTQASRERLRALLPGPAARQRSVGTPGPARTDRRTGPPGADATRTRGR